MIPLALTMIPKTASRSTTLLVTVNAMLELSFFIFSIIGSLLPAAKKTLTAAPISPECQTYIF